MTAYGAGATVSPVLAGAVAQHFGFPAAFVAMAIVAGGGLVIWLASPAARQIGH
jgi:MFS family permease